MFDRTIPLSSRLREKIKAVGGPPGKLRRWVLIGAGSGPEAAAIRATVTMAGRIVALRRKEMTERNIEALVDLYLQGEERADVDRELEQDNAELRAVPLGKWGISRRDLISSSPALYGQTVLWAAAIHSDLPDADGLVWTSNQCDPDDACLFFGDRVQESDFSANRSRDGGSDKSFVTDVRNEGRLRGITLTI